MVQFRVYSGPSRPRQKRKFTSHLDNNDEAQPMETQTSTDIGVGQQNREFRLDSR